MIGHLVRLCWNRKRANALIMLEIFVCFVVLTAVTTGGAYYLANWRQTLGFDYHDVWQVEIDYGRYEGASNAERQSILTRMQHMLREVTALPAVESAAMATNSPYSTSTTSTTMMLGGKEEDVQLGTASLQLQDVLRLDVERGRWLARDDVAQSWLPVVINRKLARARFGDADPLGQPLDPNPEPEAGEVELRVVGVITDLRRNGEFSASPLVGITLDRRLDQDGLARPEDIEEYPPSTLLLRTSPGTTVAFESQLLQSLNRLAPDWSFNVNSLASRRESMLRFYLLPLLILALIAAFLVIMVGLGLVGVLWQNVTRRTSEMGLRRALGGTAGAVRGQIMGELLVLTTLAVGLGSLVVLQFPILDILPFLRLGIYLAGIVAALFIIYGVVALCGLYPSWLATRIHPGTALQHE
jgi:putative ABC transport system permease protein